MAAIVEDTAGKIRDKPISQQLRHVLEKAAAAADVDTVLVTSGGQAPKGSGGKRTGSTRHDRGNAADLQILKNGRALNFTQNDDLPIVEAFVTAAAANGATGIGAGVAYMGPKTLHVGFGRKAVWGKDGKSANAPAWLKAAVKQGWDNPADDVDAQIDETHDTSLEREAGRYIVVARDGLRLRGGPGLDFGVLKTVETGTEVTVAAFDGAEGEWARVDLEGDGVIDGHMFAAFLIPADFEEHSEEAETEFASVSNTKNTVRPRAGFVRRGR